MDNSLNPARTFSDQSAQNISRVEELAYDLKVSDVMTPNPITIGSEMRMADVMELMRQKRISGTPVVDEGEFVGIVSLNDLIRSLCEFDFYAPISKYMSPRELLITVQEYDPVIEAIETFSRTGVGRLPVLNADGKLVGIISKGDITRGVLAALQKDYQVEELRRYRASHLFEDIISDRTSLVLRYQIKARDFTRGGHASSSIKKALLRLGASAQLARRCGIAVYESEMNLIIHTLRGGILRVQIEPSRIHIRATDDGPGIADVDQAMQAGYSTAPEEIRELGFGAGMGLINMKRCVDSISLNSALGRGTVLEMEISLDSEESFREGMKPKEETRA
jgi:CBS domain-containing protein/anti-sigma regulatory factor (Ser/Thr protein kinase)